jgi:hypothetical protein
MSNAYQQAQYRTRASSPSTAISVGQIFAAAMLPGLMLVALYLAYVLVRAWAIRGHDAPAATGHERATAEKSPRAVAPPIILIVAVLGAILGGVATPTEAAAVGAVGALAHGRHKAERSAADAASAPRGWSSLAQCWPIWRRCGCSATISSGLDLALGAAYASGWRFSGRRRSGGAVATPHARGC